MMKRLRTVFLAAFLTAAAGMTAGCELLKPYTAKAESRTYVLREPIDTVIVECSEADVRLLPADEEGSRVVVNEADVIRHTVSAERGVLKITREKSERANIMLVNVPIEVLIYLPEGTYGELKADTSSGNIRAASGFLFGKAELGSSSGNISFEAKTRDGLSVRTSSGNVYLDSVRGKTLSAETSSGNVTAANTVMEEELNVRTSSGDVRFDACDAPKIGIRTSSGDVEGRLLSPKTFKVTTSSGSVSVPDSRGAQTCEIRTSSGDVSMTVPEIPYVQTNTGA
ncbi:MAG: DUF4097 family beta strand repeat protein [Lachnospiraceae bacterium]|nr:DUF4097 family beta strand repeat protein [Lachnospiraceae bacterium]